ncbi:4320_t:CDS:2 [Cetraspora pellucida]|uniref:4320_t:CDS:1 n=1 Tax=Cetraspora pellucida TaxID=1433469 RepID=A0A9N9GMJ2_9GLOM|nr:4320_t:CDS:2 [Cetraspora pellucida]
MIKNFIQNFNIPSTTSLTSFTTTVTNNQTVPNTPNTSNIILGNSNESILSENFENLASKEKIILNVGGIKYETYRSTLTAYPTTLLGSVFLYSDYENSFWDPDLDEFFIDRDGHLFHYIMQFYRTGKVPTIDQAIGLIPITSAELEDELDYFKIPTYPPSSFSSTTLSPNQLSLRHKMIASEIDSFIQTLTSTLLTISSQFKKEFFFKRNFQIYFEINFHDNDRITDFNISPSVSTTLKQQLQKEFDGFSVLGYAMLEKFGDDIGRYMISNVQGCTWECNKTKDVGWGGVHQIHKVKVGVENSFEHEDVVEHCCLANVGSDNGI